MKHLNLMLASFALFSAVGGYAQTDVTSTYLQNADFESGIAIDNGICTYAKDMAGNNTTYSGLQPVDGWTAGENGDAKAAGLFAYGGTPFLGGAGYVAPATSEGKGNNALGLVAVWQGIAQYTQAVTLPAGTYTLTAEVYNGAGTTKAAKNLFGFIASNGTEYLAPAKAYAVGSWETISVTFVLAEETAGQVSIGYTAPNAGSAANMHLFYDNVQIAYTAGNAELEANTEKVAGASATNPILTDFVVNGTFDAGNTGWQRTASFQNNGTATNQQGDFTGPFWENWNSSAMAQKMYQTARNIPNGTYRLKIAAFVNNLATDGSQYVFANDNQTPLTANGPLFYEVWTVVTNNEVTFGLEQTTATANWLGIDNVSLTYYGEGDVIEAAQDATHKADYDAAVANANTAKEEYAVVTGEEMTALDAELAKPEPTTAEGYDAAVVAINAAVNAVKEVAPVYEAFNAAKAATYETLPYAAPAKYEALTAAQQVEAATSAADAQTKIDAMKKALRQYVESNSVAEGVEGSEDFTSVITNPNAEAMDGWTLATHDGGATMDIKSNEPFVDGNDVAATGYFDGGNWNANDWTTSFTQDITVPAGKYVLAVTARGSANLRWFRLVAADKTTDLAHVGANVEDGVFGRGWNDGVVEFTTNGGTVTIKVDANTQTAHEWQSFSRFRLTRIGNPDADVVTVSSVRYATYVTKTAVDLDQVEGLTAYAVKANSADDIVYTQVTGVVAAGTPLLINGDAGDYAMAFSDAEAATPANNDLLVADGVVAGDGQTIYVLANGINGLGWYLVKENSVIKAGKAYLKIVNAGGAKEFIALGEVTGINTVATDVDNANAPLYNVAGQRVGKDAKGLVIKNGKKIIIK